MSNCWSDSEGQSEGEGQREGEGEGVVEGGKGGMKRETDIAQIEQCRVQRQNVKEKAKELNKRERERERS